VGLTELYYAYGQANKAVCKTTGNEIFHIADLYEDHEWSRQKLKLQNQLMEALTQGRLEKALKYFDAIYTQIGQQKDSVFELVVLIFRIAHDEHVEENELLDFSSYLDELNTLDLKRDWYQWIVTRMKYIAVQIQEKKDQKCSVIVERTKALLKAHYTDELTLEGVARTQNISPQYLSKLFKEETSYTFVEYLTRLRIEFAQHLMVESDLSIKEICYSVGYSDPNYFSRLFRKQTGLMPKSFIGQFRTNKT
jgi:two-component system response regulator YesN